VHVVGDSDPSDVITVHKKPATIGLHTIFYS